MSHRRKTTDKRHATPSSSRQVAGKLTCPAWQIFPPTFTKPDLMIRSQRFVDHLLTMVEACD
ncbi:hypothetical protein TALK_19550 [Thalassospira alkalitolerans]|uniref:Uncharacterized protein n=1 Tax=Thalassospira alkalitolerans TaxID=1293890 RepID=A0A1Y2L721_9PROT|nr:hypothetical protein TALK_19550 [Thalassospira alkalitolerans]